MRLGEELRLTNYREKELELTILIPCLNEQDNICEILDDLNNLRNQHGLHSFEVLVLDDASTDQTFQKCYDCIEKFPNLNLRVVRRFEPRRGYGAIVRFGIANARGKYCVPVAADRVDPIDLIPDFLKRVRNGADLVQCSRYLNPDDAATIPFKYKFYQVIWRFLIRVLFAQEIRDSTYAFKIFSRVDVLALGLDSNRFSISPEIFFKVMLSGGKIEFVAAGQGVRQRGKSKFIFRREGLGYGYVLARAWLHKTRLMLWF